MTNFEKWKDSLTPKGMADALKVSIAICDFCPVGKSQTTCPVCRKAFLHWANTQVKEETK